MYEAYLSEEVVSKLPFDATCITSCDKKDKLFIGSKQGHLLCCARSADDKRFEYQVSRTFEKRMISELKVVENHDLILCLTVDSQLSVHIAAEPFTLVEAINKYRPINAFAHFVRKNDNMLIVAVASRKRIYIFKWLVNNFEEETLPTQLYSPDNVQRLCWCNEITLIVVARNEYFLMKVFKDNLIHDNDVGFSFSKNDDLGKAHSLITNGNRPTDLPLIIEIPEKQLLGLCRENVVVCVTAEGKYVTECRFSDAPLALACDSPYLIAILPKGIIEIRTIQPPLLVQKVMLDGAATICSGRPGRLYIGSDRCSWILNSFPLISKNVKFLAEVKQYELAATLAKQNPIVVDSNCITEINRKMALLLFASKKFTECFNIHYEINTDVILVLNFYSQIIPEQFLNSLSMYSTNELNLFDSHTTVLNELETKSMIASLSDYLSAKRTECAKVLSLHYKDFREGKKQNLLATKTLKNFESVLELLDTVLLKCYILTKPMLVPSLLRLPDNRCIISEAEKDLFSNSKFAELLIFYERKKIHRKALELLKKESKNEESQLYGVSRLAEYLRCLNESHLKLIFEFAPLVFAENIELGVEIFTGSNDPTETIISRNFDHEEVYQFLKKQSPTAVILYLEHIIYKLKEQRPKFHDILVDTYISEVKRLMKDYIHTLCDDEFRTRGGEEDGELGILRKKLMNFLEFSKAYSAEKVLTQLDDCLLEEKAILYGRMNEHEKAFCIYANILMDFDMAERHCLLHYSPTDPINSLVFFQLFKAYTTPNNFVSLDFTPKFAHQTSANITEALKILRKHAAKIDTVRAISLIPMDTPLSKIWEALQAVFEAIESKATQTNMLASITERAVLRYETRLQKLKNRRTLIDSDMECMLCKKKIMSSAFVRLHDGSIAHFFCHRKSDSQIEGGNKIDN